MTTYPQKDVLLLSHRSEVREDNATRKSDNASTALSDLRGTAPSTEPIQSFDDPGRARPELEISSHSTENSFITLIKCSYQHTLI